jgi:hypothetical protein
VLEPARESDSRCWRERYGVVPRPTDQRGARKLRNKRVRTGKIMAVDPALRG